VPTGVVVRLLAACMLLKRISSIFSTSTWPPACCFNFTSCADALNLCPAAAFRAGAVMGFLLASFGLAALFGSLLMFRHFYRSDWTGLYEAITGFGLGGSAIALFGRVGGGIYTKAADVGADLVGKIEKVLGYS